MPEPMGKPLKHLRISATPHTSLLPAETVAEVRAVANLLSPHLRRICGDDAGLRRWSHSRTFYLRTHHLSSAPILRRCGDAEMFQPSPAAPHPPTVSALPISP